MGRDRAALRGGGRVVIQVANASVNCADSWLQVAFNPLLLVPEFPEHLVDPRLAPTFCALHAPVLQQANGR